MLNKDTKRLLVLTIILVVCCLSVYIYSYIHRNDNQPTETSPSIYRENISKTEILNENSLQEFMDSGTGILYFGFESCPWCNSVLPVLIETASHYPEIKLYSYDPYEIREEESEVYQSILNEFNNYLLTDDDGNKRLYVPDVYAIYNGEPIGSHKDAVDGYSPNRPLTDNEVSELKKFYEELFESIKERSFENAQN